ncbi:amino acid permease [Bacillus sp. RG28]|uniref:Amino acid permease n=1 Tax=Gottfriedia endophytica TaxID=2820819 RepID=A0A940NKD8_9BACI|nr:amino acid permease [Gottfriedia endophytica]MBP0726909.1 amino acid permease [Gottfriedia endophytica]
MSNVFRKKSISKMLEESSNSQLKRSLGAFDLTLLGIGMTIGTGIFVLTGIVAATHAGPAISLSFVLAGIACALTAFCYAEFASTVPISGSVYTYSYATIGELVAFIIGWDLMLEYLLAVSAVASGWSAYFQSLIGGFGIHLPAAITSTPGGGSKGIVDLPAVLIVLIITALLSKGIKESARVNNIMVIVKLAVIILFIIAGAKYVKPANWHPFMPFGFHGIVTGAATVFFAFIGFDAVATAAEEVRKPKRDLPIGIISALTVCTILYIAVSQILTGMVPYTKLNLSNPVSFALQYVGQDWLAGIISVGAIIGITTVLLVSLFGQVRISYSMSKDGLLPKTFSKVHPKFQTPFKNTWMTGIVAALIGGFVNIGTLAELINMGTLLAFTLVSLSILILRKRHSELKRGFRVPFVPVFPIVSAGLCIYLILNLSKVTWIACGIWIVIGLFVYFSYSKNHSKLNGSVYEEQNFVQK